MEFNQEKNNINKIKEAIIRVVVFFDMFDFPVTSFEIWKYLDVRCELGEVNNILNFNNKVNSPTPFATACRLSFSGGTKEGYAKVNPPNLLCERGQIIEEKNGFYFLAGRSEIVDIRMRRYNFADIKFKRAVRMARVFKFIPWIKMIAVGNIIGRNNAKAGSDIDLFIVTEKNRTWVTRFFCVVVTKMLGLRPRAGRTNDTICLSFFVSEEAMDLQGLMLDDFNNKNFNNKVNPPTPFAKGGYAKVNPPRPLCERGYIKDIYFVYWLACLEPVFDRGETYDKFVAANRWIYEVLPNWDEFIPTRWREAGQPFSVFYRDLVDMFFGRLEKNFMNIQMRMLPFAITEKMNVDSRVVVNDIIIKTHTNDRREEYREKWQKFIE